jgi:hypothetical protein
LLLLFVFHSVYWSASITFQAISYPLAVCSAPIGARGRQIGQIDRPQQGGLETNGLARSNVMRLNFERRGTAPIFPMAAALPKVFVIIDACSADVPHISGLCPGKIVPAAGQ